MLSTRIVMAATFRSTQAKQLQRSEPKPVTLWVASAERNEPASGQDAAATQAIGLQLDTQSSTPLSRKSEATLTLKRRTVELLFDPATGETSWLHSFGLRDEVESVARCRPKAHITMAKSQDELSGDDMRTAIVSPSGRIARLQVEPGKGPTSANPKAEAERDNLVGMLLASGWTWRDADDTLDH
jgi:hypothetical protein